MTTRLLDRFPVAEGTMAFRLEKPAGFTFKPGQNVDLTLLDPPETDAEGNVRTFSLACDPAEDTLLVATRLRNTAFKRVFQALPLGSVLSLDGPHGDLTLPHSSNRTIVLLAGGIGITPFRPMVLQAAREKMPHRIVLFYGNRRPEDAAFLDELLAAQRDNPRFTCIAVMSEMEKSARPWTGPRGLITAALLQQHLRDAFQPLYFLAGPPAMVAALRATLNSSGADDDDIRTEEFAGY
ncbi:MAG TPA: FAD-dependent oxidoreductase [Terriglobales bacterium]|nr:FAD-dependent oxidoreductase [Terriglobales bacterium]